MDVTMRNISTFNMSTLTLFYGFVVLDTVQHPIA